MTTSPRNNWVREQTSANDALLKFIRDHGGRPPDDLVLCLDALKDGNIIGAIAHARLVKPHGMGGLTNWFPQVISPTEDLDYLAAVLQALVNEWCRLMALSFDVPKEI